jgi:hypothetical protein
VKKVYADPQSDISDDSHIFKNSVVKGIKTQVAVHAMEVLLSNSESKYFKSGEQYDHCRSHS